MNFWFVDSNVLIIQRVLNAPNPTKPQLSEALFLAWLAGSAESCLEANSLMNCLDQLEKT